MPNLLVRDVSTQTLEALKAQAKAHGRSLQGELKIILENATQSRLMDSRAVAAKIRRLLSKRLHTDSAMLLRDDRRR